MEDENIWFRCTTGSETCSFSRRLQLISKGGIYCLLQTTSSLKLNKKFTVQRKDCREERLEMDRQGVRAIRLFSEKHKLCQKDLVAWITFYSKTERRLAKRQGATSVAEGYMDAAEKMDRTSCRLWIQVGSSTVCDVSAISCCYLARPLCSWVAFFICHQQYISKCKNKM